MRPRGVVIIGLLTTVLAGCASADPVHPSTWLDRLRTFQGPTGPDVVQMDVALLERPVGDGYINQELWELADEQVVAPERRAVFEDNGLRVGQIGGLTPAALQALLTSGRSCVNPRRIRLHSGSSTTLVLGPRLAQCRFDLIHQGETTPVSLDQAQMVVTVVPALTPDGKVRLQFTPVIHHGEPALVPRPAADRSGWVLQECRPTERYDQLAWEVTLAPNEYVVIGTGFDRQETFGHQAFVRPDEVPPVQRLMVLRTTRGPGDLGEQIGEETISGKALPLAIQAALPDARGIAP